MTDTDFSRRHVDIDLEIDGYTLDDYFFEEFGSKYPNRRTMFLIQCVRPAVVIPEDGYFTWC